MLFDLSGTVHSSYRYLMFLNCMTLQNENTSERWRMVGSPTPIYTTNPSRPVSIVGCVFVVVVCLYVCCFVCFVYCLSMVVQLLPPEGEPAGGVVNKCIMLFVCLFLT